MRTLELALEASPLDAPDRLRALPAINGVARLGDKYRLAVANMAQAIPQVTAWAEAQGARILALNTIAPSLEDVFLMLTQRASPEATAPQEQPDEGASKPRRRQHDCGGRGGAR